MATKKLKSPATETSVARASGWTRDSDQNEVAYLLYDEIVNARDRLAGLAPLTPLDLEMVALAMHEIVFFLITPPRGAKTPLPLSDQHKGQLLDAARNRDLDLYVTVTALVARKTALRRDDRDSPAAHLTAIRNALDGLTFDYRRPKRETIGALRALKADFDSRIAYVTKARDSGYRFRELPEAYAKRSDKRERADQFFRRVYGPHLPRGLTQADIRKVDPAFYNVLHVWCSRRETKLSALVPATRVRRH